MLQNFSLNFLQCFLILTISPDDDRFCTLAVVHNLLKLLIANFRLLSTVLGSVADSICIAGIHFWNIQLPTKVERKKFTVCVTRICLSMYSLTPA